MTNKKVLAILGLVVTIALSGCGSKSDSADTTTNTPAETSAAEATTEASDEDTAGLDPITPSSYLVDNPSEYVTLGDLDNLEATQAVYEITDEMVQERIEDELYMYSTENEIEAAAAGNVVYADVVSTVQGDPDSKMEENTYFEIGDGDYGPEFDEQLTGAKVGDKLSFSVSFDESTWYEEWADQTVDFEVTVTGVYELVIPDYDDDFISEYTDYSSKDEYETSVREALQAEYDEEGYFETVTTLLETAMEKCTFNGYPDELYDSCREEMIDYYGQFIGESDYDAILESFGMTEEEFEADIISTINQRLFISAVCEEKELAITDDEYFDEVISSAEAYDYSSAEEYELDNTRESIVWMLYEDKVTEFLYNAATITTIESSIEDYYGDEDFDEDFDDEFDEEDFDDEEDSDVDFDDEELDPDEEDATK